MRRSGREIAAAWSYPSRGAGEGEVACWRRRSWREVETGVSSKDS
jgi:hypothetical protein